MDNFTQNRFDGSFLGRFVLFTIAATWVAIGVSIIGMGGKYSFLCSSYEVLVDKVEPHLDAAAATPKFAAEEIDLALEQFEENPLWRNTLNQQSNETQGFWGRAFSPPADPALVGFHGELTELSEEPAPNPQEVTQLIEDYQLDIDDALLNDQEYRLVDTPFRSQIYWEASSDADDMGLLFFLFFAVTISVGVAVIAVNHRQ